MPLEAPLVEALEETAHWSDDPPPRIEEEEFDRLAFELWHLGALPDSEAEPDEQCTVAERASCL